METATFNTKSYDLIYNFVDDLNIKPSKKLSAIHEMSHTYTNKYVAKLSDFAVELVDMVKTLIQHKKMSFQDIKHINKFSIKILESLNKIFSRIENAEIKIDDENGKYLIKNLKKCYKGLDFIKDYSTLSLEIKSSQQELSKNKKIYTLEQLLEELKK